MPWNKSHGYNIGRSYGTSIFQVASAVGTTDIVTRGFNLGKAQAQMGAGRCVTRG